MTATIRTDLMQYMNKSPREYRARFGRYDKTHHERDVVLLQEIIDVDTGKVVTDHVWVHRPGVLKKIKPREGDEIQFQAVVTRYTKRDGARIYTDYTLHKWKIRSVRKNRQRIKVA